MSYEELYEKYQNLELENSSLKLELNNLKKVIFGVKREHTPKEENIIDGEQGSLFSDKNSYEELKKQAIEKAGDITVTYNRKAKNKKAGIKENVLKNIPMRVKEFCFDEDAKCPECDNELKEISKKIIRQEIKYIPATIEIVNYVQCVYKCTCCGTKDSESEGATIVRAGVSKPLLTHSFVSPSLATEVIYKKYFMGVPLYRQEKIWDDMGLVLPRNMMANWIIKITQYYFSNLHKLMINKLKADNQLLHCDETTIQCNKEKGRKASAKSYMWILRSGELEKQKGVIFEYFQSRSSETAKKFLNGYTGTLITDGYASYNDIPEIAAHAECWAHTRRYFYESIPINTKGEMDTSSHSYIGLEYCNRLFEIEREIAKLDVLKIKEKRGEKSKPILEEFFTWVNRILSEKLIINNKLKKALTYASNQQKELSEFLNDGKIVLSNNLVERTIRPFAIHRKNWLFADSVEGAKANAIIYSLIESAKINNLNIYKYIEYLLEEIPQMEDPNDDSELEEFLPWSKELPDEIFNSDNPDTDGVSKAV